MTYEPQGVFAEGRTFDFGQEEGIVTLEHAKSERIKKPKGGGSSKCEGCGNSFTVTRGAVGKFCSHDCMHQSRIESRPVGFDCSRCLASVGIGMNVASRLLGVTKGSIHRSWRKEGIRAQLPKGVDSWMQYRVRSESSVCGWWGNAETAAMWMTQHKEAFPDWGSLFKRPMTSEQKQKLKDKYHNLSDEIKKTRNKRLYDLRKAKCEIDPIAKDKRKKYEAEWKKKNPKKTRAYRKKAVAKRKIVDPGFKVQCNLRHRLKEIMGKVRKGGTEHRNNLTGCSTKQLAMHLESTFKRGITWDNYGTRWHVDHIIPCAAFDHTDEKQRAQCWHWTNLRALDAKKNMEKNDTITEPQMSLLLCVSH